MKKKLKSFFEILGLGCFLGLSLSSAWAYSPRGRDSTNANYFTTLGLLPTEDVLSVLAINSGPHPIVKETMAFWDEVYELNQAQMTPEDHANKNAITRAYEFLKNPNLLPRYTAARFKEVVKNSGGDAHLAVGPQEFFNFVAARKSEIKRRFFVGDFWITLSSLLTNLDQGLELEYNSKKHSADTLLLLSTMRAEIEEVRAHLLAELFAREPNLEIVVKTLRSGKFRTRSEENLIFILDAFYEATPGGWTTFEQFSDIQFYLRSIIVEPREHKHLDLALAYFLLTREEQLKKLYAGLSFSDVMALRYFLSGRKGHLKFLELAQEKAGSPDQVHMALAKNPNRFASWRADFLGWPFYEVARQADTPKSEYPDRIAELLRALEKAFYKMNPSEADIHMFQYLAGQVNVSPVTDLLPGECARVLKKAVLKQPNN